MAVRSACPTGCEPFATPDINGDGLPEIALVVDRPGDGPKRIQLWDLTTPPGGSLAVIPFVDANGDPATFSWGTVDNVGGDGPDVFGVSCRLFPSPGILTSAPLVRAWHAIPTGPGSWHISEHGYHVVGTELRSAFDDSYDVPGEETVFPDGGGDTMCGAPVVSTTAAPTTSDLGVGFPVCDVSALAGNWSGDAPTAFLATKMSDVGGCPAPDAGASRILGIDTDGDGKLDATYGPLECRPSCRFLGAPDIDQDGVQEIAVVQGMKGAIDVVRIYSVSVGGASPTIEPWELDGAPAELEWSSSQVHPAGAFCNPSEAGPELVVWHADALGGGAYRESQVSYHMDGTKLVQPVATPIDVPGDESSLPATDTFCGSPVTE